MNSVPDQAGLLRENELRLDGRTAIVTGAGGNPGLGRAHALLLAQRGANVVVNDIGRDPDARGYPDDASAERVADEIRARGGKAVADVNSIATEAGAHALIRTAIDAFGGLDILVNNARFSVIAPFDEMTPRDFRKQIEVNLLGAVWTCRAAWPHMKAQGYGRIVNISSSTLAGAPSLSAYGVSKGGLFSLTRALAAEGEAHGIKVNTVNPGGFTRWVIATQPEDSPIYNLTREQMPAELVSPVVAYLAHEECPVSGECIETMGGQVRRVYLARTPGFTDKELTVEKLAERWREVMGEGDPAIVGYMTRLT